MAVFIREDFLELTSKNCEDDVEELRFYNNQLDLPETMALQTKVDLRKFTHPTDTSNLDNYKRDRTDDIPKRSPGDVDVVEDINLDFTVMHIDTEAYRLVCSHVYPKIVDDRSREQKIFDEACFHLGRYMNLDGDHYDADRDIIQVPVKIIFELVYKYTTDINEFR